MTQKERKLLLVDLCARLPYEVKIELTWWGMGVCCACTSATLELDHIEQLLKNKEGDMEIKPYLRSVDLMTDEENEEYGFLLNDGGWGVSEELITNCIDWLNAKHFDFRGLISKGLALEAPKDMYN